MPASDKLKKFWRQTKEAFLEFFESEPFAYSSSIAFYTLFSLPAILFFVVEGSSILWSNGNVDDFIRSEFSGIIGVDITNSVGSILDAVQASEETGVASMVSIVTLLIGATTVFGSVQSGLNRIWHVKPGPRSGLLKLLLVRVFSFGIVVVIGLLLISSLAIEAVLSFLKEAYISENSFGSILFGAGRRVVSIVLNAVLFMAVYKVLPDVKVKWKYAAFGGASTALLFTLGKELIGWYLSNNNLGSMYGAAGSVVLLLIWVYYTSMILMAGGKVTEMIATRHGKVTPSKYAVQYERLEIEK